MTDPLRAAAKLGAQLQHLGGLGIVERHTGTLAECQTTRCIEARAALAADTARPGLDVEALARALKNNVEATSSGIWYDAHALAAAYVRLTEDRP